MTWRSAARLTMSRSGLRGSALRTAFVSRISADGNGEALAGVARRKRRRPELRRARRAPDHARLRHARHRQDRIALFLLPRRDRLRRPLALSDRMAESRPPLACRLDCGRRPPSWAICRRALTATRLHATVSFDPNIRPLVTPDREFGKAPRRAAGLTRASRQGQPGRPRVALSRPRRSRTASPPGQSRARDFVSRRSGERGAIAMLGNERIEVPAPRVEVVDTVGAGDSFMSALLSAMDRDDALGAGAPRSVSKRTRAVAQFCRGGIGDHLHTQGLGSADAHGSRGRACGMIGNSRQCSLSKGAKPIIVADVNRAV